MIKLHGSVFGDDRVDSFHTLQAAIAQVGRPVQTEFRDRFLELLRNHNVIVAGYSGLDDFDLRDLWIEATHGAQGRLVWIHHAAAGDPTKQARRIVDAWQARGRLVRCHTSTALCQIAEINWQEHVEPGHSDWFSDFVLDPRIRDLALHGLIRLLIHAATMIPTREDRLAIVKDVDWLLERNRELESMQSARRRYWAIKDQALGLPETAKRHHLVRAVGVLGDYVITTCAEETICSIEMAIGTRELAWGIKDLSAPDESWMSRHEEGRQLADLFTRGFTLAKMDLARAPTSPRLFEHYAHALCNHAWGLLFKGDGHLAISTLRQFLEEVKDHPALKAAWHVEILEHQIARARAELARFMTFEKLWREASTAYLEAAAAYRAMGRLADYWLCKGCAAAVLNDNAGFDEACAQLETLQANRDLESLIARSRKWMRQRATLPGPMDVTKHDTDTAIRKD